MTPSSMPAGSGLYLSGIIITGRTRHWDSTCFLKAVNTLGTLEENKEKGNWSICCVSRHLFALINCMNKMSFWSLESILTELIFKDKKKHPFQFATSQKLYYSPDQFYIFYLFPVILHFKLKWFTTITIYQVSHCKFWSRINFFIRKVESTQEIMPYNALTYWF